MSVTSAEQAAADPGAAMPRLDDLSRADVPFWTGHFWAYAPHDFHRIAYVEWGDPASQHVVVCVHGLSRQGRDFDPLGYRLAKMGYRVICPDLPGRGSWVPATTQNTSASPRAAQKSPSTRLWFCRSGF